MTGLELVSGPSAEPVSLAEVKAQARIDGGDEDAFLTALIVAARQWIEQYCGRALLPQNWRLWMDAWPEGAVTLPKPPLRAVSEVRLYQDDDTSALLNSAVYQVDTVAQPGRIILRAGQTWPVPGRIGRSIAIGFTAGYSDAANVPTPIKAALKQLVTHWYERRGEPEPPMVEAPYGVRALLNPYRVRPWL